MNETIQTNLVSSGNNELKKEVGKLISNKILLRSVTYASAAYFSTMLAERGFVLLVALMQGFSVVLLPGTVKVVAPDSAWDQETVLLIYLMPFLMMVVAFIWLNIRFVRMEYIIRSIKLFMLWMMFFIIFRILGLIPAQIFFGKGIDYPLSWLSFGMGIKLIFIAISFIIFMISGYKILKGIVYTTGIYYNYSRFPVMNKLIYAAVVIPVITVTGMTLLFYLPGIAKEELAGLALVYLQIIYLLARLSKVSPKYLRADINNKTQRGSLVFVFILLLGIIITVRMLFELKLKF